MAADIDADRLEVIDNRSANRFEIRIVDQLAFLTYRLKGSTIALIHTEVPESLEGHGIAARLAEHALDYAKADELDVMPLCPYVSAYIRRHPEYDDVVSPKESWKDFLRGD